MKKEVREKAQRDWRQKEYLKKFEGTNLEEMRKFKPGEYNAASYNTAR